MGPNFNEHRQGHAALLFRSACKLGHEGVVAKRRDLPESGRSKRWLTIKVGPLVYVIARSVATKQSSADVAAG